jgi:phosphatidylglycerophosphatase C
MSAVAAFDFDGTLSRRDSVGPFLARIAGRVTLATAVLTRPMLASRVAIGRGDRDDIKVHLLRRTLAGRDAEFVRAEGDRYADELVGTGLRPDVVGRLHWHRERGDRVVIVSASLDVYLAGVAARLGADALLCTTMATRDGVLTGEIVGANCRAAEKLRRLDEWHGGRPTELWAYGDSAGDRELLAAAQHALLVGRDPIATVPVGAG